MVTIPVTIIAWALGLAGAAISARAVECGIGLMVLERPIRDLYPKGLGPLSESYAQGIIVHPQGDPIGRRIWVLSQVFTLLQWTQGKIFHMKMEEARDVFDLLESLRTNPHVQLLEQLLMQPPEVRAQCGDLQQFLESMGPSVIPLHKKLEGFPKFRRSTIPSA